MRQRCEGLSLLMAAQEFQLDVDLGWSLGKSCSRWSGVTCDIEDHVIELSIPGMLEGGTISPVLGNLDSMTNLDLSWNQLRGPIPASLSIMVELKGLWLQSNHLTGTVPPSLFTHPNIRTGSLKDNIVSGYLLGRDAEELQNKMDFSRNCFQHISWGDIVPPDSCADKCESYSVPTGISLCRNRLEAAIMGIIAFEESSCGCNVEFMDLPFNLRMYCSEGKAVELGAYQYQKREAIPEAISLLSSLASVNFSFSPLTEIPAGLFKLRSLRVLNIQFGGEKGKLPEDISGLSSIRSITLRYTGITGTIPRTLSTLTTLTSLVISFTNLYGPVSMSHLPTSLVLLDLRGNIGLRPYLPRYPDWYFDSSAGWELNEALEHVAAFPKDFCTHGCTTTGLSVVCSGPNVIALIADARISNFGRPLTSLVSEFTSLIQLELYGNGIGDQLPAALFSLTQLTSLKISKQSITGSLPDELTLLQELRTLAITQTKIGGPFPRVLSRLYKLDTLDLSYNYLSGSVWEGDFFQYRDVFLDGNCLGFVFTLEVVRRSEEECTCSVGQEGPVCELGTDFFVALKENEGNICPEGFITRDLTVRCDGTTITAINIIGNSTLSGMPLPRTITLFSGLKELSLESEAINALVSSSLTQLTSLTKLVVSRCSLDDDDLKDLSLPGSLQQLDLSHNRLTKIPEPAFMLPALTVLCLSMNQLQGTVDGQISRLGSLVELDLSDNLLYGTIPALWDTLVGLERLNLADNNMTGPLPQGLFEGNSNIVFLNVSFNSLSGSLPLNISGVQELWVNNNKLTGTVSAALLQSSSLLRGSFANNLFYGAILEEFPLINSLDLKGNCLAFVRSSLEFGRRRDCQSLCSQLQTVQDKEFCENPLAAVFGFFEVHDCAGSDFFGSGLRALCRDGDLVSLARDGDFDNDGASLPSAISSLSRLERIDLSESNIGGLVPSQIFGLSSLLFLNLGGNGIRGFSHANTFSTLASLTFLNLSSNPFTAWPSSLDLPNLSELSLANASAPENVLDIITRAHNLSKIDLSFNQLGAHFLEKLVTRTSVIHIQLKDSGLKGELPGDLSTFTHIRTLDLSRNSLYGFLPPLLSSLTFITFLDLRLNLFYGSDLKGDPQVLQLIQNNDWLVSQNCMALYRNEMLLNREDCLPFCLALPTNQYALCETFSGLIDAVAIEEARGWDCSNLVPLVSGAYLRCVNNSIISITARNSGFWALIPSPLSKLANLQALDLSNNRLFGEIPSWLGVLANLSSLDLSSNELNGTIPGYLTALVNLQELNLENNLLTGRIPQRLLTMTALKRGSMRNNSLYGAVLSTGKLDPSDLALNCLVYIEGVLSIFLQPKDSCMQLCSSLPDSERGTCGNPLWAILDSLLDPDQLREVCSTPHASRSLVLTCSDDILTGIHATATFSNMGQSLPSPLWSFISLTHLDLENSQVSGFLPHNVSSLRSLRHFSLASNLLSGSIPDEISFLKDIQVLRLNQNSLEGSVPSNLQTMSNLQEIDLGYNKLVGSIPPALGLISTISILNLQGNVIGGTIPESLEHLPVLESLFLSANKLYGPVPAGIVQINTLTLLRLDQNQLSGSFPAVSIQKASDQFDFSGNFLYGFSSSAPTGLSCDNFTFNCFTSNSSACSGTIVEQKHPQYSCRLFCGATESGPGVCGGHGSCYLSKLGVPTCDCNVGYSAAQRGTATCEASTSPPSLAMPSPSPPPPSGVRTTGLLPADGAGWSLLNRWSRYLSLGLERQAGRASWRILTLSAEFVPNDQFPPVPTEPTFQWSAPGDQGSCASCWAFSAADTVSAALGMSRAPAQQTLPSVSLPSLSVPWLINCSVFSADDGCAGGHPAGALEVAGSLGVYDTHSIDVPDTCTPQQTSGVQKIVMYEMVRYNGWFGLVLAVSAQPVIVSLEAGLAFQSWLPEPNSVAVFDGAGCYTGNLDHTAVLVGYQMDSPIPYWVLRNSWGTGWGDRGYMKMLMFSPDPLGACGVYINPGIYPIAPPMENDPCYEESFSSSTRNPCGGGVCSREADWGPYSYQCDCSRLPGFVRARNRVNLTLVLPAAKTGITETCVPVDACGMSATNPCGAGTCINNSKGDYSCLCPLGLAETERDDGSKTCGAVREISDLALKVTQTGLTCTHFIVNFNMDFAAFLQSNPGIDCASEINVGEVISIKSESVAECAVTYSVGKSDTCASIATLLSTGFNAQVSESNLLAWNKGLVCSRTPLAPPNSQVCIQLGQYDPPEACLKYEAVGSSTCADLITRHFNYPGGSSLLFRLNPGLQCDALQPRTASKSFQSPTFVCTRGNFGASQGCAPCRPSNRAHTPVKITGLTCARAAVAAKFKTFSEMKTYQTATCGRKNFACIDDKPNLSFACSPT